jgi:hypothetical protein
MLERHHIEIIENCIEQSAITIPTLRDDLLDHLCCVVEKKLEDGKSFEESLREAISELAPEGLYQIEKDTIMLLTIKLIPMRKFMYSIGLIASMSMTMGLLFKTLGWLGADHLFVYGFIIFGLIFLPMVAYTKIKSKAYKDIGEKLRLLFGGLSAIATGLALIFKVLHLPGADQLLIAGAGIFCILFLP